MNTTDNWSYSPDGHEGSYTQERGSLNICVTQTGCHANIAAFYSNEHPVETQFWSVPLDTLKSISNRLRAVFPESSEIAVNLGDEYVDQSIDIDWSEQEFRWSESTLANVVRTRILKVLDEMEIK